MKSLFLISAVLCFLVSDVTAQTIRSLGYNSTNDTVTATQRITFPFLGVGQGTAAVPSLSVSSGTNSFGIFGSSALGVGPFLGFSVDGIRRLFISTNTIRAEFPISFSDTNVAAGTRTNLGLGATWLTNTNVTNFREAIGFGTNLTSAWTATNAAAFRGAVGTPLPALTNTSNVTMMRALAGSTNTNQPFSGVIEYLDHTSNAFYLDVSNGIILQKYE